MNIFSRAAFFGSRDSIDPFTFSVQNSIKENVLVKQLFLDLIRFML